MAKNTNKDSTRYYSDKHEKQVCKALGALQTSNSGAGKWNKGDCVQKNASLLIECKTCEKEKQSFSIKKDWITKNKEEAFMNRLNNYCIAFSFEPEPKNSYYVIDEKLMKFLVEKLSEEEQYSYDK